MGGIPIAAHLDISWGIHPTRLGRVLLASSDGRLCGLAFLGKGGPPAALRGLGRRWPPARLARRQKATAPFATEVARLIAGAPPRPMPLLLLSGTPFQRRVWKALLDIPSGTLATYGDLARAVGRPRAARAVGQAVGANPLAVLIPCHRVVRSGGALGGFGWGVRRKQALLEAERARA